MSCVKCLRVVLFLQNFVFLLIGLALIGFSAYVLVAPELPVELQFLEGTHLACYVAIGLGAILFVIGLIGVCGAFKEIKCLLKTYTAILVLLLLLETAAALYICLQYTQFISYMAEGWYRLDDSTIDIIQSQMKCCGFNSSSEYEGQEPDSCFDQTTLLMFADSCYSKLVSLMKDNVIISASIGGALAVLEICGIISTVYILWKTKNQTNVVPFKGRKVAWETSWDLS